MPEIIAKTRRKPSEQGNWLVVKMVNGRIQWCTWVRTWAGVQASKRSKQRGLNELDKRGCKGRVFVLDIERMLDFAITEGANEISDLHRLLGLEGGLEIQTEDGSRGNA